MTNADKIRALPDETLAAILRKCCWGRMVCFCFPLQELCTNFRTEIDWLDWLESEAEE